MKTSIIPIPAAFLAVLLASPLVTMSATKPSLVLILSGSQCTWTLGCNGNPDIEHDRSQIVTQ